MRLNRMTDVAKVLEWVEEVKATILKQTSATLGSPEEIYLGRHCDILGPLLDVVQAVMTCDERDTVNYINSTGARIFFKLMEVPMKDTYQALVINVDSDALSLQELVNINLYAKTLTDGLNGRIIVKYKREE
jgi:hypothetical protein